MTVHSRVARKAQRELDGLLNGERLPEFEDRQHLPYTNCLLKELLRYVLITGSNHAMQYLLGEYQVESAVPSR